MNLNKKQIISLISFLIILMAIPVSLYLVRQTQILKGRATFTPTLEFLDSQGNVITQTSIANANNISLRITRSSTPTVTPTDTPTLTPSPTTTGATAKRVFVTSTSYDGNLGGLSGADQKCLDRANAANLCGSTACASGSWKAWLSDETGSPSTRFGNVGGSVPYKILNGTTIASNWADLTDGTLSSPINLTELDTSLSTSHVWSNTLIDGTKNSNSCNNFTSNTAANDPSTNTFDGGVDYADGKWTNWAYIVCSTPYQLYCFEQ